AGRGRVPVPKPPAPRAQPPLQQDAGMGAAYGPRSTSFGGPSFCGPEAGAALFCVRSDRGRSAVQAVHAVGASSRADSMSAVHTAAPVAAAVGVDVMTAGSRTVAGAAGGARAAGAHASAAAPPNSGGQVAEPGAAASWGV
ncbi:unnamed protein product, partial [Phaeothamnion confervicola]